MFRHFIAFICLLAVGGVARAQLTSVSFEKSSTFIQISNDSVVPSNAWILNIRATQFYSNTLSVSILTPFMAQMTRSANQSDWLWNSAYFPSAAALDAACPDSQTYAFQLTFPSGTSSSRLDPGGPKLPAFPPAFVGNAYDALQGANPNQDIVLQLDGFSVPATAESAATRLDVRDLDHNVNVFSQVHAGNDAAQFTIPASTLKPETAYYVQATRTGWTALEFVQGSDIQFQTVAGSLRTQLTFITRRCLGDLTGDGVSDLEDFFAFFNCWDLSTSCADLDGTPGVDLGDFFAFFNAFDDAC